MKRLNTLSITLGFVLVLGSVFAKAFPQVVSVQGQAWLTSTDGRRVALKAKTILKGKAQLETAADSQIRIDWDGSRGLRILASSLVLIPSIGWDSGEAPLILLKSGSLRWIAPEEKSYSVMLGSDLFEFLAPPGDLVLTYEPNKPRVDVKVLSGQMEFSYLNGDEVAKLKAGQSVAFDGILEDGKPAYDVLLKGRKVPRGKLTEVTEVDPSVLKSFDLKAEKKKLEVDAKRLKAQQTKMSKGQICHSPGASFDQCAWICEGNPKKEKKICRLSEPQVQCIRQRCNANGQWAEKTVVEGEKAQNLCKPQPRIEACDY